MSINDPLICTQHQHNKESMADIKRELACIHETGKKTADMLSQLLVQVAVINNDREAMSRAILDTISVANETRDRLAEAMAEKERVVAVSKIEHERFDKDIQAAHDMIREFKSAMAAETELFRKEREENTKFRAEVKMYAKIGVGAIVAAMTAAPAVWQVVQWIYSVFVHVK